MLASLGYVILLLVAVMPLFEWQISDMTTDFPPAYRVYITPSPWRASFGQSLDDGSYVFRKVYVQKDNKSCRKEEMNFTVTRLENDDAVERAWLNVYKNISWLFQWDWIGIVLSLMYIWWFTIWYAHRTAFHAIILTGIAVFIFVFLTQIARLAGPLYIPSYFGRADCYGAVTFNARLSKIHYETLLILFAGILLEVGALGVMLRQIVSTVIERKKAPN